MLILKAKSKRQEVAPPPTSAGMMQFPAGETLKSAIIQIATKWECSVEESIRRMMIMSLSGWKLKFAGYLSALCEFSADKIDPFQATCITLRNWLNLHEKGMEEFLSDPDVQARLEMILDTLQEKRKDGEPADLNEILAEDENETSG